MREKCVEEESDGVPDIPVSDSNRPRSVTWKKKENVKLFEICPKDTIVINNVCFAI